MAPEDTTTVHVQKRVGALFDSCVSEETIEEHNLQPRVGDLEEMNHLERAVQLSMQDADDRSDTVADSSEGADSPYPSDSSDTSGRSGSDESSSQESASSESGSDSGSTTTSRGRGSKGKKRKKEKMKRRSGHGGSGDTTYRNKSGSISPVPSFNAESTLADPFNTE
jgi:hypothetical protein